jgi:CubicO group peptidase (beta-lactamase class C family)
MNFKLCRLAFWMIPLLFLSACSNYQKIIRKPQIYDGEQFGRVPLPKAESAPFYFDTVEKNMPLPSLEKWADEKEIKNFATSEDFLANSNTTAFLVIRNDSILFENYYNGASKTTTSQAFSVTKPLIASLLMQALEEERIQSLDEKVIQYFPIKKQGNNCEMLTLKHLAQMQSGLNHYDYFRLFKVTKLYYAKDVDKYIKKAKVMRKPGVQFKYKSIDTQVLGTCLENIFDEKDLLNRFASLYWNPIGPENPGYFNVDCNQNNNMKYYGGLNISARDLAKIGKIYLNDGKFEDQQIISEEWMNYISDTTNHVGKWDYSMGWYFDTKTKEQDIFYGAGFNGQFLLMNKTTNTIIVRLGESKAKHSWWEILSDLSKLF